LKEYDLLAGAWPGANPPLTDWDFEGNLTSVVRASLLLGWEDDSGTRRIDLSSLGLLSFFQSWPFATISSGCSHYSTNCFHVRHSATPIWASKEVRRL